MSKDTQRGRYILTALAIGLLALFIPPASLGMVTADPPDPTLPPMSGTRVSTERIDAGNGPLALVGPLDYPADPTAAIPWSAGTSGVADIQTVFNYARTTENAQLGTAIPMLTLPSQAEWDAKSDGDKALWLINRERIDRGVHPLHGLESNVTSVAQYYAEYLIDNNAWGHCEDGRSPADRLNANPAIGACHDFLSVAENLFVFVTSGTSIPLPVERSVYVWIYENRDSSWEHRHTVLWYPYNENSGPADREGFLGIGREGGGPYKGPFSQTWNYAEMIVLNIFDPCATWDYGGDAVLGNLPSSLSFAYSIPDQRLLPISHRVTPENEGNYEALTWSITTAGTWFTAFPLEGTTPNSFWVTPIAFDTSAATTYNGALTVTVVNPTGVNGSPHSIDLTLRVVNSPISEVYLPLVMRQ
jgi:hypothetical protein